MSFYEKGPVRIHFQEAGSGFPLLLIAGGGLNSTISNFTRNSPFNPIEEFRDEYRCIAADLRNANSGQSIGPHVALVEAAFRAHDGIDHAAVDLGTDRAIARYALVGKSRVAACGGERGCFLRLVSAYELNRLLGRGKIRG